MDTRTARTTAAVVALKAGPQVKSRLAPLPPTLRSELAWAMSVDTLRALAGAIGHVIVVSDRPGLEADLKRADVSATVIADGQPGLNEALAHGDTWLRARGFHSVLACVGDLPALRTSGVDEVLSKGSRPGRHFVADRYDTGTTMLLARGVLLDPRFQGASADAHARSGASALIEIDPSARCDVDTADDLAAALQLGVGPATAAVVAGSADLRDLKR